MHDLPWREILFGAYVVWLIASAVSLLTSRRSPAATLAWIFAFVALPGVSGVYYWVFGPRRLRRRSRRFVFVRGELAGEVSAYARASAGSVPRLPPHVRALGTVGERLGQGGPRSASNVRLLCD